MYGVLSGPCMYDGEQYPDGSDWEILPCTKCVCTDGQHSCYPVDCPPIVCAEVSYNNVILTTFISVLIGSVFSYQQSCDIATFQKCAGILNFVS
jgi:hypothetical protein